MLNRANIVLAVLLLAVAFATAASRVDYSKPNIEVLPEMKYSPASAAFAANAVFPNGRTLQAPPGGTIARGALPLHYEATKEEAARAGEELINPYAISPGTGLQIPNAAEQAKQEQLVRDRLRQSVQSGAEIYRVYCNCCHGPAGLGDGPVPKKGFPPPPPLPTGKSLQMKDGQLFHILTYGQGSMASFAAQISREDRWHVINFVRSLQEKAKPENGSPAEEAR